MKDKISYLDMYFNYHVNHGVIMITSVKKGNQTLIIPDIVSIIADNAFDYRCNDLDVKIEKVVLPSSIYKIGKKAFQSNAYIKCVEINSNILRIEELTFSGATRLEEITLPETLRYIGKEAFRGVKCKEVFIPRNCVVEEDAFSKNTIYLKGPHYLRDLLVKEYEIYHPKLSEKEILNNLENTYRNEMINIKNIKEKEIKSLNDKYEKDYQSIIVPLEEKIKSLKDKRDSLQMWDENDNEEVISLLKEAIKEGKITSSDIKKSKTPKELLGKALKK